MKPEYSAKGTGAGVARWVWLWFGLLITALHTPAATASPSPEWLRWTWANPLPHGNHAVALHPSGDTLAEGGELGQLFSTTTLETWTRHPTGTTRSLRGITRLGTRWIITAEAGLVLSGQTLDTLTQVQLPTEDWLEAVTSSGTLAVAVGDNGAVFTSADGLSWVRRASPTSEWLRSVTHGNNRFVAVGENGTVLGSADGSTWISAGSGLRTHLNAVRFVNGAFYAVGNQGAVLRSAAGLLWQRESTPVTNDLYTIAGNGTNLVAAGENVVLGFQSGSWRNQTASPTASQGAQPWPFYSSAWDGRSFVLAGRSGRHLFAPGTNTSAALAWSEPGTSVRNWLWDVALGAEGLVTVGDRATILTSETGRSWEVQLVPDSATNSVFLGVSTWTNQTVVVGTSGLVLSSTNTLIWDAHPVPTPADLQGVCRFRERWFVSGSGGEIWSSSDLAQWRAHATGTTNHLSSLAAGSGRIMGCGANGTLMTSTDGEIWHAFPSTTTSWIYRVRYTGGLFIAVGERGLLLTSTDGTTWRPQVSGTDQWLHDVAGTGPRFYAAGAGGTLLSSTNALDWVNIGIPTLKSIYGLAQHPAGLVAVGLEGAILRLPPASEDAPVTIGSFVPGPTASIFVFDGQPSQRFSLEETTDFLTWTAVATLQFPADEGLSVHAGPALVPTTRRFYRTRSLPLP